MGTNSVESIHPEHPLLSIVLCGRRRSSTPSMRPSKRYTSTSAECSSTRSRSRPDRTSFLTDEPATSIVARSDSFQTLADKHGISLQPAFSTRQRTILVSESLPDGAAPPTTGRLSRVRLCVQIGEKVARFSLAVGIEIADERRAAVRPRVLGLLPIEIDCPNSGLADRGA